jgi:uncharacterized protein (TIGR00251 family)
MKIIKIRVIPNSKKDNILVENDKFKIHLKAKAIDNEANKSLIRFLAEYFDTKKSNIEIIKGNKSREKVVRIG